MILYNKIRTLENWNVGRLDMIKRIKNFFTHVGPGIITGASDDDPSGIAIYSQAGASAGYGLLWTAPFLVPLMIFVQEMCARIGMVTGHGLIGAMRRFYPPVLLWAVAGSVFAANTVNIGADLAAMAATTKLILPINLQIMAFIYSAFIVVILFLFSYRGITNVLKWLTFSLFAYILATFATFQDWGSIFKNTIIPSLEFNRQTLVLLVAILGTTISPYLFFWQASEESDERISEHKVSLKRKFQIVSKGELREMRHDVFSGMFFSNLVMFFIMATAASTLFRAGIYKISTAEQAAGALRPIAGNATFFLFTLGIVGTGLLAIPVLAGSAAYAVSEVLGFREGFTTKFSRSKVFYFVILLSTLAGLAFTLFNIPPFRALLITGVIYGVLSPILILIILGLANSRDVMGDKVNSLLSNFFGFLTFVILSVAAIGALIAR